MTKIAKVSAGLRILAEYEGASVCSEHDILYAGPPDGADDISPEHEVQLIKLGWFVDGSVDSWAIFT